MGQALYRKYRSKALTEIVGQEHITRALTKALETSRISHAYLFTGPRGIGKTSIARILAHEVNNLPYDESETHLDIIEIDAASNRRIDEIRDLREKVHVMPTSAKYKVYIVDEVHMLTREAFNALLKTLEEPPAHVIFILATTEAHKLPETIISRTQHFAFKPIPQEKVITHLKSIAKDEKIQIDDDALALIAQHGGGSFRDSISLLDQVQNSSQKITRIDIETVLGVAPDEIVNEIIASIDSSDTKQLVKLLQTLRTQGIEPAMLAKQLAAHIRTTIIDGSNSDPKQALRLLAALIEVPASADPHATLEIVLLSALFTNENAKGTPVMPKSQPTPKAPEAKQKKTKNIEKKVEAKTPQTPQPDKVIQEESKEQSLDESKATRRADVNIDPSLWPEILASVKQNYNTLYGVLRMAQPNFDKKGAITLTLKFAFHQKRLNEPKNKQIIAEAIEKVSGVSAEIICLVGDAEAQLPADTKKETSDTNSLGTISNIFGGAELLES